MNLIFILLIDAKHKYFKLLIDVKK